MNYKLHREVKICESFILTLLSPVVFRQLVAGNNTKLDVLHAGRQGGLLEGHRDFLLVAVDVLDRSCVLKSKEIIKIICLNI